MTVPRSMSATAHWKPWLFALPLLFPTIAGCAREDGTAPSAAGASAGATVIAAGQAVFVANGCGNCHAIGGQGGRSPGGQGGGRPGGPGGGRGGPGGRRGGPGGGGGPDLTDVGADPTHTPQWLAEHIRNPQAHNPRSRMPAFEGRIAEQDLTALTTYLASLK